MRKCFWLGFSVWAIILLMVTACSSNAASGGIPREAGQNDNRLLVVAVESFLGDIAANVAGDRLAITTLIPVGLDPHNFEPTPQDIVRLEKSDLIIINGAGYEAWLERTLAGVALDPVKILQASDGAAPRIVNGETDPHFWLDPNLVILYVENIRDALIKIDPQGAADFRKNADGYIISLQNLDDWVRDEVNQIPIEKRVLVTNHESFGYFMERYGFQSGGSILPSLNSEASPSAKQMIDLVKVIRREQIKAVFVEAGANARLAEQITSESGVNIISDLYTESLSPADGPAPTYIELIKHDTRRIVDALK